MSREVSKTNKKGQTALAVVALVVILGIIGGYAVYFTWSARRDNVEFSTTGRFGWGSRDLSTEAGRLGTLHVGTVHSYFFLRDTQFDPKTQHILDSQSPAGPAPGPAASGSHPAAAQRGGRRP